MGLSNGSVLAADSSLFSSPDEARSYLVELLRIERSHSSSLLDVKHIDTHVIIDNGFGLSKELVQVNLDVLAGIDAVRWPRGGSDFAIPPGKNLNGVKPIKNEFIEYLESRGWIPEFNWFDAYKEFPNGTLPFAVEWETGNISSSHRAINRIALGMHENRLAGGILILPTHDFYYHLTDRVGNFRELEPYIPLWKLWQSQINFGYLAIVTVEHDRLDATVPSIPKGTDGRAQV